MLKQWHQIRSLMDSGAVDLTPAQIERQELDMEYSLTMQAHEDIRRQAARRRDAHRSRRLAVED